MDILNKKTSLFKLSYGCRILFIITLLLSIFDIFLRTYMPTFIQKIIDLLNSEDLSSNKSMIEIEVQKNILILISFGLLIGISTITGSYLNVIARYRYAKNLRYALFTKVQNFSFQDIDKYPTGVIVNYLNTDVDNIAKVFRIFSVALIKMPVMFLSALIFALNQSIELSIIFSVSLPILFIFFIIMWKYGMPIFYRTFKKSDEYNNKLQENLHSIKVIKSYVIELKEQKKHDSINNEMGEISIKGEKIFTWYHIVTMNTIFMSLITLVLIGVNQVLENKITPGKHGHKKLTFL
ncbi:ABC transporter transmembrane domain-containing protein [Mycoplasmopsis felis]|uniref:ABC transporter transmembrane domain-containing protein n=1 Tax=Mycoplasmopsis felis TaxID=33923 RepID=UPI002AFE12F7|nr:ABC transporter transmembrane domain-containing protein [Mycoplasmopsis felis]WQQ09574.1 ABC transporter transmembrane domain-containing protein [Mycoplasmopsis felis]